MFKLNIKCIGDLYKVKNEDITFIVKKIKDKTNDCDDDCDDSE